MLHSLEVPKYQDKVSKKVETLSVSWAEKASGFTLLFEACAVELVKLYACVAEVTKELDIYPQRLWQIVKTYEKEMNHNELKNKNLRKIGFDETSQKKVHSYITSFIDLETAKLLYVVAGKSAGTIHQFAEDLKIDKAQITDISIDISPAFMAGAEENFPKQDYS